jgi:hypothetical protein
MPKSRKMFALRLRSIFVSDIIDSISSTIKLPSGTVALLEPAPHNKSKKKKNIWDELYPYLKPPEGLRSLSCRIFGDAAEAASTTTTRAATYKKTIRQKDSIVTRD